MDLALGAMGSLLPKLGELLKEEYMMQTSVKQDIEAFSRELRSMRAALRRVAEVPREELDEEVKLWAGDVRELSYDMEDVVDSLIVRVKGSDRADTELNIFRELMGKMGRLLKQGKARREIATAIRGIKEQLKDVATRHKRYKADGAFANLAAASRITTVDPLLVALYEDKERIVGIENARDKLIEKLCLNDDVSKQPKILSIVGFGGLGKTTLSKAIYDKVRSGFDCTAFVSVSRSPDIKKVLKELLFEVDKQRYMSLSGATLNEKQLIDQLQESLGSKRYFIVVDDIWDVSAWKTIRYALMHSECGSRIITTTRNINVSKECSSHNDDMVHNMKPLSDGDSQRLFYNRIFLGDKMCPPELQEVSMNILKKCAEVPLAIITLASHLASNRQIKPISEWYVLLNSIGSGITKGDTNLEEMRRILSFSYHDLPSHLKTCLLYLSIFPEDCSIDRDRLIRRWIAEGLIQGDNLYEIGLSYFNELLNRSMIQLSDFDCYGEPRTCRVHDIMLDLICDLASEENFVTIMDFTKVNTPFKRKVRRLSVQKEELANTQLVTSSISQVRSYTIFSPAINQMLPLSLFEVLRVLDLEGCNLVESDQLNLRCVGDLLHMRYLD
ncbi:disease resistance protein RGA5-like [Lolium rigidum]|uniref:disease resistance protein RGA5-like n=1 Tax=Lolium rigidum TaxID=89674 RepID=UPI001F5CDEB3|nr:disease resistance protein RGA5-like [Lolium rigidum]